jgi:hypothetical protein
MTKRQEVEQKAKRVKSMLEEIGWIIPGHKPELSIYSPDGMARYQLVFKDQEHGGEITIGQNFHIRPRAMYWFLKGIETAIELCERARLREENYTP